MIKKLICGILLVFGLVSIASAANVTLTWTAPADEGNVAVTSYKLVYSSSGTITEANFNNATVIATGTPKTPGQVESYLTNLTDGKHYYFAVKSVGKTGTSSISNVAQANFFAPAPITDLLAQ
jgi:hypothetical protein